MPSEKLYRGFQNLERKVLLLVNENKKLKEDLTQVECENQILKSKLEHQQNNLNAFQNRAKMRQLLDNMSVSEEDSAKLKAQIDGYIREIDKCIAHLAE